VTPKAARLYGGQRPAFSGGIRFLNAPSCALSRLYSLDRQTTTQPWPTNYLCVTGMLSHQAVDSAESDPASSGRVGIEIRIEAARP
jgi:hypothetical protein